MGTACSSESGRYDAKLVPFISYGHHDRDEYLATRQYHPPERDVPVGLLLPLYGQNVGATPLWRFAVEASKRGVPIVAVLRPDITLRANEAVAPAVETLSEEYKAAVRELIAAGVRCLGFINTDWSSLALWTLRRDCQAYRGWGRVDPSLRLHGIYFAHAALITDSEFCAAYYRKAAEEARALVGRIVVIQAEVFGKQRDVDIQQHEHYPTFTESPEGLRRPASKAGMPQLGYLGNHVLGVDGIIRYGPIDRDILKEDEDVVVNYFDLADIIMYHDGSYAHFKPSAKEMKIWATRQNQTQEKPQSDGQAEEQIMTASAIFGLKSAVRRKRRILDKYESGDKSESTTDPDDSVSSDEEVEIHDNLSSPKPCYGGSIDSPTPDPSASTADSAPIEGVPNEQTEGAQEPQNPKNPQDSQEPQTQCSLEQTALDTTPSSAPKSSPSKAIIDLPNRVLNPRGCFIYGAALTPHPGRFVNNRQLAKRVQSIVKWARARGFGWLCIGDTACDYGQSLSRSLLQTFIDPHTAPSSSTSTFDEKQGTPGAESATSDVPESIHRMQQTTSRHSLFPITAQTAPLDATRAWDALIDELIHPTPLEFAPDLGEPTSLDTRDCNQESSTTVTTTSATEVIEGVATE